MFAVSCSDECALFLSPNDDETKKTKIIDHPSDGARDMSSQYVTLKAGRSYFIEALSIQNEWVSPVRVGVRLPSGAVSAPIAREYLRPTRAGLADEIFYNISSSSVKDLINDGTFPDRPAKGRSISDFDVTDFDKDTTIGHHVSGYFLAPETGKFKFFGACTDGCQLFLSKDDTCNKREMVLDYRPTSTKQRFDASKPVSLESGMYYFIDALQTAIGGKRNSIKIGVEMPSGKSSFPIRKELLSQFPPSRHGLIREVWTNVKGEDIRDLTALTSYPNIPSSVKILQTFDAPYNERYNYGQRMRGQFVAPMTGDYRFVMSCDRKCELWLSSTASEEHKKRLLKESHVTARHQFEKYPDEQVSPPIHLDIGKEYYIEALHKAGTGLDHLSIGVTLPNGENEWPIPQKYLRVKSNEKKETHLKDPPCLFKNQEESSPVNQGDAIMDSNEVVVNPPSHSKEVKVSSFTLDNAHEKIEESLGGDSGRDKGTTDSSSFELHKMFHGSKGREHGEEPSISLDEEMSDPTQVEINKLHKSVNKLIKAAKDAGHKVKDNDKNTKLNDAAKIKDSESSNDEEELEKLLSSFGNNAKVKVIRLKSNGKLTNDDIVNALKAVSQNHKVTNNDAADDPTLSMSQLLSQYNPTESLDAIGTISKGEDFESQLLTQVPADEAQKILTELSKPTPPPKIENSDGIKVAGDSGGNLQIMEQNPFSNAIFGSHTLAEGVHTGLPASSNAHQERPVTIANHPSQSSLMTEGQPVTVVGNLAEISKANIRASALAQENQDSNQIDIVHAVGRPVTQDKPPQPPIDQNIHVAHHVPINRVSDFDVLDLDLVGLKQLSKTGYSANSPTWSSYAQPAGNFPLQISQELEATPLVSDQMASMLSREDLGSSEFYKRGNKISRKKLAKSHKNKEQSNRKNQKKRTKLQKNHSKETPRNFIPKRSKVLSGELDGKLESRPKGSWHSHNHRQANSLIKKSSSPNDDWEVISTYLKNLDLPKTEWKAGARSIINNARKIIDMGKETGKSNKLDNGKNTVIQSIVQPEDASDDKNNGNHLISSLLQNIAEEVGGNSTPLDEYINSAHLSKKIQRDIVTRRPLRSEKNEKKTFNRILNSEELKKIDDISVDDK